MIKKVSIPWLSCSHHTSVPKRIVIIVFSSPNQQNHGSGILWGKLNQKIKIMLKEHRNFFKKEKLCTPGFPDGQHILLLLNNTEVNDQARKANIRWNQETQWQLLWACAQVSFLTILSKGHCERSWSTETFLLIPVVVYTNNVISPKPNNSHVFKKKVLESQVLPAKITLQNLTLLVSQLKKKKDKLHS